MQGRNWQQRKEMQGELHRELAILQKQDALRATSRACSAEPSDITWPSGSRSSANDGNSSSPLLHPSSSCHLLIIPKHKVKEEDSSLLELCPRGNNKDVIIIILVHDNVYIPC
jgi:hypothetical protein